VSYEVSIVADSVGPNGARVTTFQLRYPRMVHAELMTHRAFSRNASSTRAIPTAKMIEWVMKDPAMPVYWGKNQKGMQAGAEIISQDVATAEVAWLAARDDALRCAHTLMGLGVHKQIASRVLEPWTHINVVVTATDFSNFFALRCHRAAMPEIQKLAVMMARAYRDSTPMPLKAGWWHLPFVNDAELAELCEVRDAGDFRSTMPAVSRLLKLSVARCARVSYKTFEGKEPDPEKDVELHDQLLSNGHWSPFEHPARAMNAGAGDGFRSGNFTGWVQYRQMLPVGLHKRFDFDRLAEFDGRDFIV
jgi:thymidylate synthase ThyX